MNHIWKGVNDLALRVDKDRDDLTILVNLDQVTFKTVVLLLWKRSQIIYKWVRNKGKGLLVCICISAESCKGACRLHSVKAIKYQIAVLFLQAEGISTDALSAALPLLKSTILLHVHKWETTMWDFFIYSPVAGSGICSVTWPTIAQHQQAKCSFKCNT